MDLVLMAAIAAATTGADVPLRATADVPRRAAELRTEADRRTAEGPRMGADRRTEAAADMGGNTALDSFPA
jgi:hypothetical protein